MVQDLGRVLVHPRLPARVLAGPPLISTRLGSFLLPHARWDPPPAWLPIPDAWIELLPGWGIVTLARSRWWSAHQLIWRFRLLPISLPRALPLSLPAISLPAISLPRGRVRLPRDRGRPQQPFPWIVVLLISLPLVLPPRLPAITLPWMARRPPISFPPMLPAPAIPITLPLMARRPPISLPPALPAPAALLPSDPLPTVTMARGRPPPKSPFMAGQLGLPTRCDHLGRHGTGRRPLVRRLGKLLAL